MGAKAGDPASAGHPVSLREDDFGREGQVSLRFGGSQQRFCSCSNVSRSVREFKRCRYVSPGDEAVPLGWQQRSDAGVRAACPAGGGLGRANRESRFLSKRGLLGFHILWFNNKPNADGSTRDHVSFPLRTAFLANTFLA